MPKLEENYQQPWKTKHSTVCIVRHGAHCPYRAWRSISPASELKALRHSDNTHCLASELVLTATTPISIHSATLPLMAHSLCEINTGWLRVIFSTLHPGSKGLTDKCYREGGLHTLKPTKKYPQSFVGHNCGHELPGGRSLSIGKHPTQHSTALQQRMIHSKSQLYWGWGSCSRLKRMPITTGIQLRETAIMPLSALQENHPRPTKALASRQECIQDPAYSTV